ncbi:fumarate reductase subunit C [Billgrantia kenyensis]|uniref:Fumarate reductase subunit C n=1 Tax=Billgrantia kenyensis TaxID=321266 RepID=A0A7V9W004_9GAMM|nr:fumarate reductase subunit C [Halomonas kenyensis]MBA2778590.1 fumarate reductase subunit C [Halomonas kenyensis]MCG6661605.1 fumarate reductase subunit C [Halomonas kenyensis]
MHPNERLPPLPRSWWLKHRYFIAYMVREATVLPLLFFAVCLLAGLIALLRGEASWMNWLAFMGSAPVLLLNGLALAASLYHAWTFFQLFPRVMPLRIAGRPLPHQAVVAAQWAGVAVVTLISLWLFMGGAR